MVERERQSMRIGHYLESMVFMCSPPRSGITDRDRSSLTVANTSLSDLTGANIVAIFVAIRSGSMSRAYLQHSIDCSSSKLVCQRSRKAVVYCAVDGQDRQQAQLSGIGSTWTLVRQCYVLSFLVLPSLHLLEREHETDMCLCPRTNASTPSPHLPLTRACNPQTLGPSDAGGITHRGRMSLLVRTRTAVRSHICGNGFMGSLAELCRLSSLGLCTHLRDDSKVFTLDPGDHVDIAHLAGFSIPTSARSKSADMVYWE